MATITFSDVDAETLQIITKLLIEGGAIVSTSAGLWTAMEAEVLLYALVSPRAKDLIKAIVAGNGHVDADVLREEGGTLRGLTGPITKTIHRLVADQKLPAGLQEPITTEYDPANPSFQRAKAFTMDQSTVAAFAEALEANE